MIEDAGVAQVLEELAEMKETDPEGYEAMVKELRDDEDSEAASGGEQDVDVSFTPEQQAKVDEIVRSRIAREKEKWEKENPLRGDLEQTAAELEQLKGASEDTKRKAFEIAKEREFNSVLERMGADPRRRETLRKLVDLQGVEASDEAGLIPNRRQIERALTQTYNVMPEAFGDGARSPIVSAPSTTPAGGSNLRGRFTPDQLKVMSPEEINSEWDRVAATLESMPGDPSGSGPGEPEGT